MDKTEKLTAREGIEKLLDGASFVELGRFFEQTAATPGYECATAPGEGVITGYGSVLGRPVYVFAQDSAVLAGSMSRGQAEKIIKVLEMAEKNGSPVVGILNSAGSRVSEGAAAMGAYNALIKKLAELSGVVPTIAVAAGPCIGAAAVLPCVFDFTVAQEGSGILLHSPQVSAAHGKTQTKMSDAQLACSLGAAQFLAADEAAAFALVRKLLALLPQNNLEDPPAEAGGDPNRLIPEPDTRDSRELVKKIADAGSFLEAYAAYGQSMITGFIRLNGYTAGIIANVGGTAPDADACRKAARFISLLDAYHLPILTLADAGDIQPGVQDAGLPGPLSSLLYAYSQATAPMVTVVTGKVVGAGLLAMCPKSAGADVVYAWKNAVLSALPPEAGALIVYDAEIRNAADPVAARQEAIGKYTGTNAAAAEAARQGVVDDVIEPSATRQMVIAAFEACASKRLAAKPPKKHGVWPL